MADYLAKDAKEFNTNEGRLISNDMWELYSKADEDDQYLFALDFFNNVFMTLENFSLSVFLMYTADTRCLVKAYQNDPESTFITTIYDNSQIALQSIAEEFYNTDDPDRQDEDFKTRMYRNELNSITLELVFEDGTTKYYTLQEIDRFDRVYEFDYKLYSEVEIGKGVNNNEGL